jgi:hypothetical protein
MKMAASWMKMRDGSWGVRVPGGATAGQSVTVTKKSGESSTVIVGKVVWSGNGVALCAVKGEERSQPSRSSGNGYAPGKRCYCAECGEPYRKGQRCWENGGSCVPSWE